MSIVSSVPLRGNASDTCERRRVEIDETYAYRNSVLLCTRVTHLPFSPLTLFRDRQHRLTKWDCYSYAQFSAPLHTLIYVWLSSKNVGRSNDYSTLFVALKTVKNFNRFLTHSTLYKFIFHR